MMGVLADPLAGREVRLDGIGKRDLDFGFF